LIADKTTSSHNVSILLNLNHRAADSHEEDAIDKRKLNFLEIQFSVIIFLVQAANNQAANHVLPRLVLAMRTRNMISAQMKMLNLNMKITKMISMT